ncbi:hypothetical protein [Baaleninema simplex]|uniref:hypothetical protein n=1 Tax=Baaleninema simplex TaxID=2862350 RepID=UPI00034D0A75|nr:hypothetical protein [Baaleninema simplex]
MSDSQNFSHLKPSRRKKLEIIQALLEREQIPDEARKAFRSAYPSAPDFAIGTAVFHIYVDGIHAALDWLVDVELFLRDPENHKLDIGAVYHLIYHLYNWMQFSTVLPETREDIHDRIKDIKRAIEEDDKEASLLILEDLQQQFNGSIVPPDFL